MNTCLEGCQQDADSQPVWVQRACISPSRFPCLLVICGARAASGEERGISVGFLSSCDTVQGAGVLFIPWRSVLSPPHFCFPLSHVFGSEAVVLLDARLKLPLRAKLWPHSLCRWPKVTASHWGHPYSPAIPSYGGPLSHTLLGNTGYPSTKEAPKTCGYRIWQELRERPESGRKNRWVFSRQNRGKSNK